MNELITPELSELPAMPVNEIKEGVDKIGGYIGMLSAAKKATADQTIIDEVNDQIRKYSALKLRWQMELGRRTSEIPKASGGDRKSEDFQKSDGRTFEKTRTERLKELGISKQRASENERMASEPEIVEKYIEKSIEQDEAPTTSGALKAIREVKNKTLKQQEKENVENAKKFLEKPQDDKPIASFQEAVARKEALSIVKKAQAEKADDRLDQIIKAVLNISEEDIDALLDYYRAEPTFIPNMNTLVYVSTKLQSIVSQIGELA